MADSAIAAGFQTPQIANPLVMYGQTAHVANDLQQIQARQAIGQAWQQAVDPETGVVDPAKMNMLIAANPKAAFLAGDAISQGQALRNAQLAGGGQQLAQAQQSNNYMNQTLGSLLQKPDLSYQDVMQAGIDAVNKGAITKQTFISEMASMPQDPSGLKQRLTQHLLQNMQTGAQLDAMVGAPQMVGQGDQTTVFQAPMLGNGRPTVRGSFQTNLSPGEATSPRTIHLPGGGTADVLPDALLNPKARAQLGDGSYRPPGVVGQSQSAQQQAAGVETAGANAKQGIELNRLGDQVPARRAGLDNMLADLGNFTSGPYSDQQKNAIAAANKLFGTNINAQEVASQENFAKIAKQLAMAQTQGLGAGTDEKLTTAMGANPNVDLSKLGNQQIIGMLKGNEDAIEAKNKAWQRYKDATGNRTGSNYDQFSAAFNEQFDPRIFQARYMSQAQKQDMLKSMSDADRKGFVGKLRAAAQNGWLNAGQ